MCLITKCRQETVNKKLENLTFPLIMWKVMKVEGNSGDASQLIGLYRETKWCRYKLGLNVDTKSGELPFFKIDEDGDLEEDKKRTYLSGFHAFFDKKDAENLAKWTNHEHEHFNYRKVEVIPITVKKEDILHVGKGVKRGMERKHFSRIYATTIPVAVVKKFRIKKKDYEKAIS